MLGKHTDYAGGRSLLCAASRGFCVAFAPRADRRVRLVDTASSEQAETALDPQAPLPPGGWALYPATVARRLARNFEDLAGADVAFASDLPRASGLSSSSALVVAAFSALAAVNRLEERSDWREAFPTVEALAGYLGCVENGSSFGPLTGDRGVGTFGGSEDHTAMLSARPGALVQYAFGPVRLERVVPFPDGLVFAVASSGVAAPKAGSARERYNRLSLLASAALDSWNRAASRADATLASALASAPDAPARLEEVLARETAGPFPAEALASRVAQFREESERLVPTFAEALGRDDRPVLGEVASRSQALAEELLKNQVPETRALVRSARSFDAVAASAFGAGFGGSVWALVEADAASRFLARWEREHEARFPDAARRAAFFLTRPGPPRFFL